LDAGVHSLPAGGGVDVGGVAAKEDISSSVAAGDSSPDLEGGQPFRVTEFDLAVEVFVEDFLECMSIGGGSVAVSHVGDQHSIVFSGKLLEQRHAVFGDQVVASCF
jgi:hypothetical protein